MVGLGVQNHKSVDGYLCDLQMGYVRAMQAQSDESEVRFNRDCAAIATTMRARYRCSDPVLGNPSEAISNLKRVLEVSVRGALEMRQDCEEYADAVIERCASVLHLVKLRPTSEVF